MPFDRQNTGMNCTETRINGQGVGSLSAYLQPVKGPDGLEIPGNEKKVKGEMYPPTALDGHSGSDGRNLQPNVQPNLRLGRKEKGTGLYRHGRNFRPLFADYSLGNLFHALHFIVKDALDPLAQNGPPHISQRTFNPDFVGKSGLLIIITEITVDMYTGKK